MYHNLCAGGDVSYPVCGRGCVKFNEMVYDILSNELLGSIGTATSKDIYTYVVL